MGPLRLDNTTAGKRERGTSIHISQNKCVLFALGIILWLSGCAPTLTSQVFSVVESHYVEQPDFSKLRLGALVGLSKHLPPGMFNIREANTELVLDYRAPGAALSSKKFSASVGRGDGLQEVEFAYRIAREIAPSVDEKQLQTAMLKSAVEHLDSRSEFLDAESYSAFVSGPPAGTGGIGVEFAIRSNYPTVVRSIEGGPAERAGILPDDQIVTIDGKSTANSSLAEALKLLRGPLRSEIKVSIRRKGWAEDKTFTLMRAVVPLRAVRNRFLGDGIGVVTLSQFTQRAGQDIEAALQRLEAEGMRDLILDLRGNSGGVLDQAVAVAGKFFDAGTLICRTSGRGPGQTQDLYTRDENVRKRLPLFVLAGC
jgi:C-terminal peptidase prc